MSIVNRVRMWLDDRQLLPSVIEDSRAFKYASNAAAFLACAVIGMGLCHAFDTLLWLTAILHIPAVALLGAFHLAWRLRIPRYNVAEGLYFSGLAYSCAFLPGAMYLLHPTSNMAMVQFFSGCFVLLYVYPLRPALLALVCGLLPAVLLAASAALLGVRSVGIEPVTLSMLILNAPIWITLRAYADRTTKDKVFAVKTTTDTIAHEMRTPMMSIEASCEAGRQTFARFLTKTLSPQQMENPYTIASIRSMTSAFDRIEKESMRMHRNLNLLLQNASSPKSIPSDTQVIDSMAQIVQNYVGSYPFYSGTDLENIHLKVKQDFAVKASPAFLEHVITNLIKNALHAIQKAGKGEIFITVEHLNDEGVNLLRFKDTGCGMPKAILAHIFTPFYTTRLNGTGLGLAFCRRALALFGAVISADSVENEFTEFTIRFPTVEPRKTDAPNLSSDDDNSGR